MARARDGALRRQFREKVMPTVSVFIASYNHGRYLGQTLDSVLAQTYQDFEIVVVDDGSTDNSPALLEDYARRFPDKLRYSWHPGRANKGVTYTSNDAIAKTSGPLLAWLGSDDVWMPEKLAREVALLERRPDFGMVCSYARIIDQDGNPKPGLMGKPLPEQALEQLLLGNDICPSTILIRRACLDDVGVFTPDLVYSDWDLFIRIAARYAIGFIPEPLAMYRVHGSNMSISTRPGVKLERNLAVLNAVFERDPSLAPAWRDQALARVYLSAALDCFAAGQDAPAREHMARAAQLSGRPLVLEADGLIELAVAYALHHLPAAPGDIPARERYLRAVFAAVAPAYERAAVAKLHILEAFEGHNAGDRARTRRHLLRAVSLQPSWLRNSGVLSIGARACLGPAADAWLRKLARAGRGSNTAAQTVRSS
jgi:glycosyltransferase involved in cell wall biosynthesis